jgi:hypothetical protein
MSKRPADKAGRFLIYRLIEYSRDLQRESGGMYEGAIELSRAAGRGNLQAIGSAAPEAR